MKIKERFVLRQIARNWIAFALGASDETPSGLMSLNESGVLLWKQLEKGCGLEDLAQTLVQEYGLAIEEARADAAEFVDKLRTAACLEE